MKQPVQQRAKNTVNAVIEAGFICVSRYGAAATTIQKIAEISGVSTSSIYDYFNNKDDIFNAMRMHFTQDVIRVLNQTNYDFKSMSRAEVIRQILNSLKELFELKDGMYIKWLKENVIFDQSTQPEINQIIMVLSQLTFNYVVNHPELMQLRNMPVMLYIFANAGIFTVLKYLTETVPVGFNFDELVNGLIAMVDGYVLNELSPQDNKSC